MTEESTNPTASACGCCGNGGCTCQQTVAEPCCDGGCACSGGCPPGCCGS